MSEQEARCEGGCGIEGPHERDEYCPAPERPNKCPTCGIAREHDGPHYRKALKQAGKPMCPDPFHDPAPKPQGLDAVSGDGTWDEADERYAAAMNAPSPDKVRGILRDEVVTVDGEPHIPLEVANRHLHEVERERDRWREEAWRCYLKSGADPDGGDSRHLNPGDAVHAVIELRAYYDAACDEAERVSSRLREVEAALRGTKQVAKGLREAVEACAEALGAWEMSSKPSDPTIAQGLLRAGDKARRALASLDEQGGSNE